MSGVEYIDGVYNFSTVQTVDYSSWSMVDLSDKPDAVLEDFFITHLVDEQCLE